MNEQKGVFRLDIPMVFLLGLFGLVADAHETQQKVDRLIKQLQDQKALEKDRNTRSIRSNQELRAGETQSVIVLLHLD